MMYSNNNININPEKISYEISLLSFKSKISHYEITDKFRLITNEALTLDEELEFKTIAEAHTPDYVAGNIRNVIANAMDFGQSLLVDFSSQNVLEGITQAGKTEAVLDYLGVVKTAIDTGSLYLVIAKIDSLLFEQVPTNLAPFVTVEKLNVFKAKIENYLGI